MLNIHRALNNERLLRALTGLNRKGFETLVAAFTIAWLANQQGQKRKRAPGGIPDEIGIAVDLGFLGLQKEYDNIDIPQKKPRGGCLTRVQKQENREKSRRRVRCENAFAGVKRYRIVSEIYRNRRQNFDDRSMLTATGLWNFYLIAA